MANCFVCKENIPWMDNKFGIKTISSSKVDLPLGFTDSDMICNSCFNKLKKDRKTLRIQGNCFFCNTVLGIHDKKWYKEDLSGESNDFTFCDMCCSDCIKKGDILHEQVKRGPTCSICGTQVTGYGYTCPKCNVKVSYQKKKGSAGGWYLLSILFGLLGGIIGYVALRQENPGAASNCLIIGVVITILSFIGALLMGVF